MFIFAIQFTFYSRKLSENSMLILLREKMYKIWFQFQPKKAEKRRFYLSNKFRIYLFEKGTWNLCLGVCGGGKGNERGKNRKSVGKIRGRQNSMHLKPNLNFTKTAFLFIHNIISFFFFGFGCSFLFQRAFYGWNLDKPSKKEGKSNKPKSLQ